MSLYHEAAKIVNSHDRPLGNLKSRIYSASDLKAPPKQLYALISQAAKWSPVLAEIIGRAGLLAHERRRLSPALAVLLVHDLLLARSGVALPVSHPLRAAVERHRSRLQAELARERIRRGCASLEALRELVQRGAERRARGLEVAAVDPSGQWPHPRWARVNVLKTTLDEQLSTSFGDYRRADSLKEVLQAPGESGTRVLHVDEHVPDLIALPPSIDLSTYPAYLDGCLILQDKASCFPALLLGACEGGGDFLDACAAPGNKTTHLAALLPANAKSRIYACERDKSRALTLQKLVSKARARAVTVLPGQDFLQLDPDQEPWCEVKAVLLDPSCSGSGILGRDETFDFDFPKITPLTTNRLASLKRKFRMGKEPAAQEITPAFEAAATPDVLSEPFTHRIKALAEVQTKMLLRVMRFPQARRVIYSTCSIYEEENETVILSALRSPLAVESGWRVLERSEQAMQMREWPLRGSTAAFASREDGDRLADACIRCVKHTEHGTQGFFVAGLVRDGSGESSKSNNMQSSGSHSDLDDEELWSGFTD